MIKKKLYTIALSLCLSASCLTTAWADSNAAPTVVMENCGAYLFQWRPVDCGNGHYFSIIVGANTINENNVVLNMGYDFAYTFDSTLPKPWGQPIPDLANVNGVWGIPENWPSMPADSHPTLQIVLTTNNKDFATKERYVDIVKLPSGVASKDLPPEVRKYLINADGSDAGATVGTEANGWVKEEDGRYRYRKPDDSFISDGWLKLDNKSYYFDKDGYMLADTVTPDGFYVNASGVKQNYIPGWKQVGSKWKYILKNGSYAANQWIQDKDQSWYYFNMIGDMVTDTNSPDGYHVDANGVWDGQPSTINTKESLGPGVAQDNN